MKNFFRKKSIIVKLTVLSLCATTTLYAAQSEFENAKNQLWDMYLELAPRSKAKLEYDNRAITFKDKTMRFSLEKIGKEPENGYPLYIALHGGGQTSTEMNDSQWEHMKIYYKDSVKEGIYVAARGVTDNWNLHFEAESYPLYDKLIECATLFDHVDPNRVYLLGFSAGGDGVYQVVPRMADRFAAGNMSAGHHNGIKFDNLYNTPFLMQVGELDAMFDRNKIAAKNNVTMNDLNTEYGGGYIHDVYIHYNGYHNGWGDNDSSRKSYPVIIDPTAWLNNGKRDNKSINTNAMDWLNQYTRDPAPKKIVWDLSVGASERVYQTGKEMLGQNGYTVPVLAKPKDLFYWLDVSIADKYPDKGKLVVELENATNTIKVLNAENIDTFRVLLNPALMDLSVPVNVQIGAKLIGSIKVKENIDIIARTMLERSDKDEIYDAQVDIAYNKTTQKWEIKNSEKV